MARNTSTLTVKIVSDASSAAKGFDQAESRVAGFQRGLDRAAGAATAVLGGIGLVAKGAFDAASSLEQASGAVASVFADQARVVEDYAKGAADANNLSERSYKEMAAVVGSQLKNMGVAHDQLAPKTDELIDLGSDLAATFGGTTSDAVSALSSLLRGERDPIERYGVAIKAADVEARLAAQGLSELEGPARTAAEGAATMALLFEQTSGALGATARESDTAAGSTENLKAKWEDAQAALGESLLPVVTDFADKLKEMVDWLKANKDLVEQWVPVLASAAVAILAINAAARLAAAAQVLWNLAMLANPLVAIIAAILIVIGIIGVLYYKFEGFRNFVNGALQFAFAPFFAIGRVIMDLIDDLRNAENAFDVLKAIAVAALNLILAPLRSIWDRIQQIAGWFSSGAQWIGDLFSAPQTMTVTPVAGGSLAGLFGAADGAQWAPIRGASMSSLAGGTSPSSGQGTGAAPMIVNVTVEGALDPVAVGRQLEGVLRDYGRATGRQVAVTNR